MSRSDINYVFIDFDHQYERHVGLSIFIEEFKIVVDLESRPGDDWEQFTDVKPAEWAKREEYTFNDKMEFQIGLSYFCYNTMNSCFYFFGGDSNEQFEVDDAMQLFAHELLSKKIQLSEELGDTIEQDQKKILSDWIRQIP